MALIPGTRLGPYEVTAQIGVGGMGGEAAVNVLPEAFAQDAEQRMP